jgi:2-aminoadipate transaminase
MSEIKYGQYVVPPPEEFVNFGVGQPSPSCLPLELVKEKGLSYINTLTDSSLLQYGDIPGYKKFREDLATVLQKEYNKPVERDELFITNAVTDALMTIGSMFSHEKPIVLVEDPTYFLAKDIFEKDFKFDVRSVPMTTDGMNMNVLTEIMADLKEHPRVLLYTIPSFHNPTSITMSDENRLRLAELADQYSNLVIIADEVYQQLYFDSDNKPPLPLCYYTKRAISLGSFSKILAPAFRMGWMQIRDPDLMKLFTESGHMDSSGGKSPFVQAMIHGMLGSLNDNIEKCRTHLRTNCDILADAVTEQLSEYVEFVKPTGGYFLWLKLKNNMASDLLKHSNKFKVKFHSGQRFSVDGGDNYIRLSFSYYNADGMRLGVQRLKNMFEYMVPKFGVLGWKGRLGSKIFERISNGVGLDRDYDKNKLNTCSVICDVSKPEGTFTLLTDLLKQNLNIPLVIGTTGLSKEHDYLITEYSKHAPVAVISNFSQGIPQFVKFIESIKSEKDWNIDMVERHHKHKKDAPSGTALTLASKLSTELDIKSVREGEVYGEHTLVLSTDDEELTITHRAKTRELFAFGALKYCDWIVKQPNGLYYELNKKVPFSKYSALGNDFVIIANIKKVDKQTIQSICNRGLGVGADGLILVSTKTTDSKNIVNWKYYNADGGSVRMCGNGARSVVQMVSDNHLIDFSKQIELCNNFDIKQKAWIKNNEVSIEMPYPIKEQCELEPFITYCSDNNVITFKRANGLFTVGVPHLVFTMDSKDALDKMDVTNWGRTILNILNIDANVNFYAIDHDNPYSIYIRTYERGVYDETYACGSGCCAVVAASKDRTLNTLDKMEYNLTVKSGEKMKVVITDDNITLTGPANKVYEGVINI